IDAGASESAAVAGSGIVLDLEQNDSTHGTRAYLASGATVHSKGQIAITATDNADKIEMYAGQVNFGESAGVGASATILVRHGLVDASVGSGADVQALGGAGLTVTANQTENLVFVAVGGSGGEDAGVAGSVVVDDMHSTTKAHIDSGAVISGPSAGTAVAATATTTILSIAGALAIGGTAGVGAGIDVEVVSKDTEATIDNLASVATSGDVTVDATSSENITSIAVGGGFGGDAAVNVNVGVSVGNAATDATLAGGPLSTDGAVVTAGGNVRV